MRTEQPIHRTTWQRSRLSVESGCELGRYSIACSMPVQSHNEGSTRATVPAHTRLTTAPRHHVALHRVCSEQPMRCFEHSGLRLTRYSCNTHFSRRPTGRPSKGESHVRNRREHLRTSHRGNGLRRRVVLSLHGDRVGRPRGALELRAWKCGTVDAGSIPAPHT